MYGMLISKSHFVEYLFTLFGKTVCWKANSKWVVVLSTIQVEYIVLIKRGEWCIVVEGNDWRVGYCV